MSWLWLAAALAGGRDRLPKVKPMKRYTDKELDLIALGQDLDQLWAHLRDEVNAESGLILHLLAWAHGKKVNLSAEDKAKIRLFAAAGLMTIQCMNLRAEVIS